MGGGLGMKKGYCLGGWGNAVAQRRYEKAPLSSERKEKMRRRHLRWMETTGMSANR